MVSANRVAASGWMEVSVVVFLPCYSAGLQLPLSCCYCRLSFINPVLFFLPPTLLMLLFFCLSLSHRLQFLWSWSVSVQLHWPPHSPPHPITCYYPIGWQRTTFHWPYSFLYKSHTGATGFIWILKPWGWDWYVVLKCRQEITITCCLTTQKSTGLNYFEAEALNHEQFS
jgi:hypothetical protein